MSSILEYIGNTPLVKLGRICTNPNVTILAKCEFMNPSGSVKDRMVAYVIDDAEKKGLLKPGGVIVEGTSGNTGAAVAMIAAIKGYRAILVMPDKVSMEKQNALTAYGAEIVVCPTAAPPDAPEHYVNTAIRIASEIPGSYRINQYDNKMNPEAHYYSTAPEIWKQCCQYGNKIDYFVAAASTGGTISGISKYLKEQDSSIKVVMPDPIGSIYHSYFKTGIIPHGAGCTYHVEGIGEDHIAHAMDFGVVDDVLQFTDKDAFQAARRLAREEGILAGGSSGANLWACLEIAKNISTPTTIVTILPDSGIKYLSKMYNDIWMTQHQLM